MQSDTRRRPSKRLGPYRYERSELGNIEVCNQDGQVVAVLDAADLLELAGWLEDAAPPASSRAAPERELTVGEIMSTELVTVDDRASLLDAVECMAQHRTRHLLVLSGGVFVGLVSDRDVRLALPSRLSPESAWGSETGSVLSVCFQNPVCVTPETTLSEAADLMLRYRVGSLPVLKNGELAGIVTSTDFVAALEYGSVQNDSILAASALRAGPFDRSGSRTSP